MSLFGKLFGGGEKNARRPQPATVKVFDQLGRELQIPREQWRTGILPGTIRKHWSDPEQLYGVLVQALEDGFESDIIAAAKHLHEIGDAERGAALYGFVLMQNGDLRGAERIFTEALQKRPRSGPLLTNLAKVHHRRGNQRLADDTLWRALNADPNFDNALLWYAAIERERGGDAGYTAALKRVARLRGSWRANIWLAREHLAAKELDKALPLYESVLAVAADQPGVLTQISGDLGKNGFVAEILRLVLPFYDPTRHELIAGGNLLQACVELKDVERGEKLLHEMMLVAKPPERERLMWYSSRFSEITAKPSAPEPRGDLEVEMLRLDQPIWTNGLGDVDWLLPPRTQSTHDVAVLAFSVKVEHGGLLHEGEVLVGREDRIGRWSRALALHLTDVVRFRTDASSETLIPVIPGKGMLAPGQEWIADAVKQSCAETVSHAITGHLSQQGETCTVRLSIWKLGDAEPIGRLECSSERCDTALLDFLVAGKIATRREPAAVFRTPAPFDVYLDGLGQLFALGLSRWQQSEVYGERNIHRWMLSLARNNNLSPVARIGFIAALANSRRRGSDVYRESETEALTLFASVTRSEADLYRFSPAVFRLFDRMDEFEKRRNELMASADDRYIRWLASLDTLFDPATNP